MTATRYNYEYLNLHSSEVDARERYSVPALSETLGNLAIYLNHAREDTVGGRQYPSALLTAYDHLNALISKAAEVGYSNHRVRQDLGLHASTILMSEALESIRRDHLVFNADGYTGILAVLPATKKQRSSLLVLTEHGDANHGKRLSDVLPNADQPWIIATAKNYGFVDVVVGEIGQKGNEWVLPCPLHYDRLTSVQVMNPEVGRKALNAAGDPDMPAATIHPISRLPVPEDVVRLPIRAQVSWA